MENYKQKYEQAMLRMNKWVEGSEITDPKEVAEFVFPELKESEDERIRNNCIHFLELQKKHHAATFEIEECISWLEKQEGCTHIRKELFEHLKQSWYKEGFADGKYSGPSFEKKELKKIEQKPAWSKWDKMNMDTLIHIINNQKGSAIFEGFLPDELINWLKSLKERYTWKPSDEQMKTLNYIINLMASSESPTENDYYYNVLKDMRTHLKKLR